MAITATVRRMQVDAVPHGLAAPRSRHGTEEAYWRGDLFDKRVRAMRSWAEFLSQPTRVASATLLRKNRGAKPSKLEADHLAYLTSGA